MPVLLLNSKSNALVVLVFVSILTLSFLTTRASAFPNGAGSCPYGIAAVAGSHVDVVDPTTSSNQRIITTGPLSAGNYSLEVGRGPNKVSLMPSSSSNDISIVLPTGEDLDLNIVLVDNTTTIRYRGFLIRLEAVAAATNTSMALLPDEKAQIAQACYDPTMATGRSGGSGLVEGICHDTSRRKNKAGGFLRMEEEKAVVELDVTVVVDNTNDTSTYYHSRYTVRFEEGAAKNGSSTPIDELPSASSSASFSPIGMSPLVVVVYAFLAGLSQYYY